MRRRHISHFRVEFGDCDPAQIVFYPNFFRWMDAASLQFFVACGMPPWRELAQSDGIIGTPIVDVSAKFLRPATYGDTIEIETSIAEWRDTSFVMNHLIRRGTDVLIGLTAGAKLTAVADAALLMVKSLLSDDPVWFWSAPKLALAV